VTQLPLVPEHIYPFDGSVLLRGDHRYHYVDEGEGDAVVMVHGNPSWSIYYRSLVLGLKDSHRAIAPDHIGCGLSDKPGDAEYGYRLKDRIDDLEALIEHTVGATKKLTLVAHDWGGMIAMGYAARHPERIARIVLLNTAAFHLPSAMKLPVGIATVRNSRLGAFSVRGLNSFARAAATVGCKRNPMSPELKDAYCAPYNSWDNRIATLRFVQDIPLGPEDPSFALVSEIEASLEKFADLPILLCWGMRDFVFTPEVLKEFEARWPKAEVERWNDCGHYVLEDASREVVARIKKFLEENPVSRE